MDDPAVAGRGSEAERVRLEQGHRAAGPGQLAGGIDARVASADHDDVGRVRQRATRSVGQGRHRRAPQRAALEVGVHRVAWHRRIVASDGPWRAATGRGSGPRWRRVGCLPIPEVAEVAWAGSGSAGRSRSSGPRSACGRSACSRRVDPSRSRPTASSACGLEGQIAAILIPAVIVVWLVVTVAAAWLWTWATRIRCPRCRYIVEPPVRFCPNCGYDLLEDI